MDNIFLGNMARLILPFISLFIALATVVILLDCIWRAEKRLKKSLIFLAIGVFALIVRKIFLILGFDSSPYWYFFAQYVDMGLLTWFFLAAVQMYKAIRIADHEKK